MEEKSADKRLRRLALGESSSEPNLATGDREVWLSGFPPGFTVDGLRWHRKKKPPSDWGPKDNLQPEPGSMNIYKSEYKRSYKQYDFLPASTEDLSDPSKDVSDTTKVRRRRRRRRQIDTEILGSKENIMDHYVTEQQSKYIPLGGAPAQIVKRSSSLQREGDFLVKTSEMQSNFKPLQTMRRAELTRRPTSLKLEGDLDTTTETAEKFIDMLIHERPRFAKMTSSLYMEGEMETLTEKSDKFKKFDVQRPAIEKQKANLQLEGELIIKSEKQEQYVPFNLEGRPSLMKRDTNLRLEGEMEIQTENQLKYQPIELQRAPLAKRDTNLQLEGELDLLPEYRTAYVDHHYVPGFRKPLRKFPDDRDESPEKIFRYDESHNLTPLYKENYKQHTIQRKLPLMRPRGHLRPEGEIDLTTESSLIGRDILAMTLGEEKPKDKTKEEISPEEIKTSDQSRPTANLITEGRIESNPEYRSSYVDYKREGTVVSKATLGQRRAQHIMVQSGKEAKEPTKVQTYKTLKKEIEEKKHEPAPKTLEEHFECDPEYRKAYINYLQRENIQRIPRLLDQLEQVEGGVEVPQTPPSPKVTFSGRSLRPIRDRTVPRTPKQEKILVPDLSGNAQRRNTSIFGPKQLRKSLSRPTSPVGHYKYVIPVDSSSAETSGSRHRSPCKKSSSRKGSPCRKPPKSCSRERSVPSSPCGRHRSPSGKPCLRKHSPCARLSRTSYSRPSSPCRKSSCDKKPYRQPSPCEKKCCRQSSPCDKEPCRQQSPCDKNTLRKESSCPFGSTVSPCSRSPSRQEQPPIHLYPPTPKKSISAKATSSSEEEFHKPIKAATSRRKRDKKSELLSSFVILKDDENNNSKVKKSDEKQQRWMPTWYEQPRK